MELAPIGTDLGSAIVILAGVIIFAAITMLLARLRNVQRERSQALVKLQTSRAQFDKRQAEAVREVSESIRARERFDKLVSTIEL